MSSYNQTRLAGLDAMVLHFSNSSSLDQSTVLDGVPYVTIPRTMKNRRSMRPSRTPLGDRTPDLNITPSANLCKHDLSPTPTQPKHSLPSRPKPCQASTSFHPLPPVPSSSTLQLPSFSNYNIYSSTPLPKLNAQPSAPPSPVLPLSPDINLSFRPPQETPDIDEYEYSIPAYHHPNSPYVPWALPVRREILCPPTPTSFISSEYSRSYSRSGARAPEPVEPMPEEAFKSCNGWRRLGRALKKNVKHIAKCLANPFKAVASHISASASIGSRLRERHVFPKQSSQTDKEIQTSAIRSLSIVSLDSGETTTLTTWLAARRLSFERDYDPQSTMSLEENERQGSWASMSRTASGIDSSCGVPECGIHAIMRDQARSTPWLTSPQSPQSCSFPHLPSLSSWEEREKEICMPGGWV